MQLSEVSISDQAPLVSKLQGKGSRLSRTPRYLRKLLSEGAKLMVKSTL